MSSMNSQRIHIFTNDYPGGWMPQDLGTGLGGSEECIIGLASALAKTGAEVIVWHTQPKPDSLFAPQTEYQGVTYRHRELFTLEEVRDSTLITWKDHSPHEAIRQQRIPCRHIHWTADVEPPWNVDGLDAYVCISKFHLNRTVWMPGWFNNGARFAFDFPLGVDLHHLMIHKQAKVPGTMLYSDSPDRGLTPLLRNWPGIRSHFPLLKLRITYGFDSFDRFSGLTPSARALKDELVSLLRQDGIEPLGRISLDQMVEEYWKAQYWCLPLVKADAALNSLNAQKAQLAGCIPVVNKFAALKEVVGPYIPFEEFCQGKTQVRNNDQ